MKFIFNAKLKVYFIHNADQKVENRVLQESFMLLLSTGYRQNSQAVSGNHGLDFWLAIAW